MENPGIKWFLLWFQQFIESIQAFICLESQLDGLTPWVSVGWLVWFGSIVQCACSLVFSSDYGRCLFIVAQGKVSVLL
jgi:hypothetical protein